MTKKIFLILLSLVLALSVGLVACGGGEEEEEEEVVYEYITLGAPLPTGYNDGKAVFDNLKLAIDEINDAGGFTVGNVTYKFKLEVMDTNDLAATVPTSDVQAVVEKLILDKKADFIIGGPMRSDAALAVMDTVSAHKTVAIWSGGFLSGAYGPKVAGDYEKYKYCFRTQGSSAPITSESVTLMDSIAAAKGLAKTAYIIVQDVAHAKGAGNTLLAALKADGWTVNDPIVLVPTGTTSFSVVLDGAAASGANFLWLDFDMPESASLIKDWYDRQLDMLPIGFVVPALDSLSWTVFSGKCAYLVNCYVKAGITPINPQAAHYIDLHKAVLGVEPGLTWAATPSYQVVYILKDAIVRAGSLDTAAVITALENTNLVGVYGKASFNTTSHDMICTMDPSTGAITTWVQWINGARVTVYPTIVKTADVVLPPWM